MENKDNRCKNKLFGAARMRDNNQLTSIELKMRDVCLKENVIEHCMRRIKMFQGNLKEILVQLSECRELCELNNNLVSDVTMMNYALSELRENNNNLLLYLHKERTLVLKLTEERDTMKMNWAAFIEEKADLFSEINRLQHLLYEATGRIKHMVEQRPKPPVKHLCYETAVHKFKTEAAYLSVQLQEQRQFYENQINLMEAQSRLKQEEHNQEKNMFLKQIAYLNHRATCERLKLCKGMKRLVNIEKRQVDSEEIWLAGKAELMKDVVYCQQESVPPDKSCSCTTEDNIPLKETLAAKDRLLACYRNELTNLELNMELDKLSLRNMQKELQITKKRMAEKIIFLQKTCEEENRRRLLENEGFRNQHLILKKQIESLNLRLKKDLRTHPKHSE